MFENQGQHLTTKSNILQPKSIFANKGHYLTHKDNFCQPRAMLNNQRHYFTECCASPHSVVRIGMPSEPTYHPLRRIGRRSNPAFPCCPFLVRPSRVWKRQQFTVLPWHHLTQGERGVRKKRGMNCLQAA